MTISLKDMSRKDLLKLETKIQTRLKRLEAQEKKQALAALKKAATAQGFTLEELIGSPVSKPKKRTASSKPKQPGKPKYAHPENPALTWTGKGRQPVWFKEAVDAGKKVDDLLIK